MKRTVIKIFYVTSIFVLVTNQVWSQSYSGGSGTSSDPYQIATKADLKYLSENSGEWSKHFIQIADINFSASDFQSGGDFYNSGNGFIPIGTTANPFTGSYEGNGTTIAGLTINRTSENCSMFGRLNSSSDPSISNLGLTSINIVGSSQLGGLVGFMDAGIISNCYTTGSVTGTGSIFFIGGLVGYISSGSINNSYSTCTVQGGVDVGGFVGYINSGTITNCYARGNVGSSSDQTVGGFAGQLQAGTITHCYSTGTITSYANYGAFTYASFANVSGCFWDTESSGESYGGGFYGGGSATGKTTSEMQTQSTFTDSGWNFTNTWEISGTAYPTLRQSVITIIALQSATNISTVSATYHARVNPRTKIDTVRFLYGTSSGMYTDSVNAVPNVVEGDSLASVTALVTGLSGGATYYYTVSATSAGDYQSRTEQTFTTSLATVTTGSVSILTDESATLNGSVNPGSDSVTVRFLYGTTSGVYTDSVNAVPGIATGDSLTTVQVTLAGLNAQTMYYYNLAASSSNEYVRGSEKNFLTASATWGSSLVFDKNDSSYAMANAPVTTATDSITIETWVKWDGTNTGLTQLIVSNGRLDYEGYSLCLYPDTRIALLVNAVTWYVSDSNLTANQWTHLAVVRNNGTWLLFKDGHVLTIGSATMDPNTPASNFFIGGQSSAFYFSGEIDEVRVSNVARYTSSFEPFGGPLIDDGKTIALYRFNEGGGTTVGDSSGNGNDLTIYNATWTGSDNSNLPSAAKTTPGATIDFTGTTSENNYIEVPYSSVLNPSDNFSVELWVKAEGGNGENHYRCALGSETSYPDAQGYYFYASNIDTWEVWIGEGPGGWLIMGSGIAVMLDSWTHLALTYSSGTAKFYVNGTLVNTQNSVDFHSNTYGVPFRIGEVAETLGVWPFNGKVDEVRVWQEARSAVQIRETMHRTVARTESGLVAYFQLGEGTGSVIQDPVTGFTGTVTGNIAWATSTIPVGSGSSSTQTNFSTGTANLGTVSMTMTNDFDNAVDLTATQIGIAPNTLSGVSGTPLDDRYWIVNAFGTTGTFAGNLTFTVPSTFTLDGAGSASNYILFHRSGNDDGVWTTAVSGASGITSTTITFNGVNSFSQFAIGTEVALPVELTTFTVSTDGQLVKLNWQTATEVNNHGFEVEKRMKDAAGRMKDESGSMNWKKIGFVEGNGTTNAPKEYSYTDKAITSGIYSYRLKQIDRDGNFSFSTEVEVTVGEVPKVFALEQNYPNPFNPSTTIGFTLEKSGMTTLKIYDVIGREVATLVNEDLEAGIHHQKTFDAKNLSSGIYFAQLHNNGKQMLKKLVLLK